PATDETNLLWEDIHDTDGDDLMGNYSDCYNLMVSLGYNPTQVSTGTLNATLLAGYDVLVLVDEETAYAPDEITAVQDWVANGGKLLMIGEWASAFNMVSNNLMLQPYGMQFISVTPNTSGAEFFATHPVTTGLNVISWAAGPAITYNAPAEGLAWDNLQQYGVTINESGPIVLVIGDSNLMQNTYMINDDNLQFMTNVFNYLATSAGPYSMNVDLTYVSGSPVPAGGCNLNFDVFVEHFETVPISFDAWLESAYEGGDPTTLVLRAFSNYQPGWTINRPGMFYPVPGAWAAGNYTFTGKVGNHPDDAWDESGFPFEKLGVADATFKPFPVDGAPNPFADEVEDIVLVTPTSFTMSTYPNPFNPTTTLSFTLPADQRVSLSVFDISGRQVAQLVDGYRSAGSHEVTFDASHLASGMYIYILEVSGSGTTQTTVAGKMMLLK
ncbi:T9SS type A sorting domain-containing protein, partial [bacterium]|nr:T9SS type A sorting domain-containing protein [bacterium]